MKFARWIRIGSLILLMCAHQGDSTLILGSMLMAATAAMTGGLIMGPLTVGGLIMMMMMAANNQNAQQRQAQSTSATTNIASTLENSQNLLNLLATLTGAASNLAGSASTQQASVISPTNTPKASKRALYSPQNLDELLAESSRMTATRRQWHPTPQTTTTTTGSPEPRMMNDFWSSKPATYFSPDTGFAVEPIPDDLLDIAMRLPQAKNANMFGELFHDGTVSHSSGTSGSDFENISPPRPITSAEQQLRWVASEPGDLFSSFPEIKEEDILNLVRKRSTREAISSKFRLEDIANVTYANDKDPVIKEQLDAREDQEMINTRIFRQLSALDPFRCLPQLACNMQAAPPSRQTGILNDYAYLLQSVFVRDDEDDEKEDNKPASAGSVIKQATGVAGLASDVMAALGQGKRKKKLAYKSPSKGEGGKGGNKKKKSGDSDEAQDDKNDDDDDDDFSSEETPMDEEELERLLLKEQYEMEQAANEELLNDDPDLLPFILKSASKGPSYLGSDRRTQNYEQAAGVQENLAGVAAEGPQGDLGGGPSMLGGGGPPPSGGGNWPRPGPGGIGGGRIPAVTYAQPPPLFSSTKLAKYRTEDLDKMSSRELTDLWRQVTYPGEEIQIEDGTFGDNRGSLSEILSSLMPKLPDVSVGFTRRRTHTGNTAFDEDPFFDDFDFRRRSMNMASQQQVAGGQPKLRKVRRVVRRVKESGPAARVAYLRRMKNMLDSEKDPAVVFKMAKDVGAKIKSSRQCRFLFNSCPLNSTQLLGMIGNIRKAVVGLSNAQQLLSGNVNLAALSQQAQTQKDFEANLATLGPNVVTFPPTTVPAQPTAAQPATPPPGGVHQLTPMAAMQIVQPMLGMPQTPPPPPPPPSSQNTIVVPQIVQVPMPIHQAPAPQQPIIIQQQPQMQMPQQMQQQMQQQIQQQMQMQQQSSGLHTHPVFNVITDSAAQSSGLTSISHELPSGEKVEISMKLTGTQGQQSQPSTTAAPTKTRKKPAVPQSPQRPTQAPQQNGQPTKTRNPAADLVDLFDDDNTNNYLLPSKTLIDTIIKEPSTSMDSLHAAILAIEKINQAAAEKKTTKSSRPAYLEDDESEDWKINSKLAESLKKPIVAVPVTKPKKTPSGLRLPNKKQNDEEDDETSEEDDEEEDDEGDEFGFRRRLPDPIDPKKRHFVPVPTRETQFQHSSQLTIPATQTFVKKHLQVEESAGVSSSEEDEPRHQQQHPQMQRRMLVKRKVRRPRILYPQEDFEKPKFLPL